MGIEPTLVAWEATVLPLNYARMQKNQTGVYHRVTTQISLNGVPRTTTATTVAALLDELAYTGKRVAVENNGEIVPKSRHATTPLQHGDALEIVVAVGGG